MRAHFAAKECGLKLIYGTEISLESSKLILLATDRGSYGALSSLITTGRRRGKKGAYALARSDLEALEKTNALVLWIPGDDVSPAAWLAERSALPAGPGSRSSCIAARTTARN